MKLNDLTHRSPTLYEVIFLLMGKQVIISLSNGSTVKGVLTALNNGLLEVVYSADFIVAETNQPYCEASYIHTFNVVGVTAYETLDFPQIDPYEAI